MILFHQDHFAGFRVIRGIQAVEIQAGGHVAAVVIFSVPNQLMLAGGEFSLCQAAYFLAFGVVDIQAGRAGFCQREADIGSGVEGIGVVCI